LNYLSNYDNVFCDSIESLEWAYNNGLSENALIRTSSPAILCSDVAKNISHVESRWTISEMKLFQTSSPDFFYDSYCRVKSIDGFVHESSLAVVDALSNFQRILYKAACLSSEDYYESRLFLKVESNCYSDINKANSPWDKLIGDNIHTISYTLKDENKDVMNTDGISLLKRAYLGGYEAIIYRIVLKLAKYMPLIKKRPLLLIQSENELLIETATNLFLKGVDIKKITLKNTVINEKFSCVKYLEKVKTVLRDLIEERVGKWVVPEFVENCVNVCFSCIYENLREFDRLLSGWSRKFIGLTDRKVVIFANASGNLTGFATNYLAKQNDIPLVSAQHGVTPEISQLHGIHKHNYEINTCSDMLFYNYACKTIEKKSGYAKGNGIVVGMSKRHTRTWYDSVVYNRSISPLVYLSPFIPLGNIGQFMTFENDYAKTRQEMRIITDVFARLQYSICYKPYPVDNRRYVDESPVINHIEQYDNIDVFNKKNDMRYLLNKFRVVVTGRATSAISWPIIANKPTILINNPCDGGLTDESIGFFENGIFLFHRDRSDFYDQLLVFLSKPLDEIEGLWEDKYRKRKELIELFFTSYGRGAGKRAAEILYEQYYR